MVQWLNTGLEIEGSLVPASKGHCVVSLSKIFYALLSTSSTQETSQHGLRIVDLDLKSIYTSK